MREDDFQESVRDAPPPRDLGLSIAGTRLEIIAQEFFSELSRAGISRLRPRLYLAPEWGVSFQRAAIAIPYYLAHADLARRHARDTGRLEDFHRLSLLRRLRHSMGHVINYAYRIYDRPDWILLFGSMSQPAAEPFSPHPFSRKHVRHLPAWHAQRHPDEDWAETFAVWMTPERDWQLEYEQWPEALAKLGYCGRIVLALRDEPPLIPADTVDDEQEFSMIELSDHSIKMKAAEPADDIGLPAGVDGTLRIVFEESPIEFKSHQMIQSIDDIELHSLQIPESQNVPRKSAADLFLEIHNDCIEQVHQWTGHRKDRIRSLLLHLRERAASMRLFYRADQERSVVIALTAYVTTLSTSFVHHGRYLP